MNSLPSPPPSSLNQAADTQTSSSSPTQDSQASLTSSYGNPPPSNLPPYTPPPKKNRSGCLWAGIIGGALLLIGGLIFVVMAVIGNISKLSSISSAAPAGQTIQKELVQGTPSLGGRSYLAMVEISGVIMDSTDARKILKHIREDDSCKGLLLVVNSPGGGVTASDEIWNAIQQFQKTEKPVVVYMGSLAASGGYYISASADWIVASHTTITGSIGVIIQSAAYKDALDRIGVTMRTFTSGDNKAMLSPTQDMTPEQMELIQGLVDSSYDRFVNIVSKGRNIDEQILREGIADGRIVSAQQALEANLVDALGYEEDAIREALSRAGLSENAPVYKLSPRPKLSQLLGFAKADVEIELMPDVLTELPQGMPFYLAPQGLSADFE